MFVPWRQNLTALLVRNLIAVQNIDFDFIKAVVNCCSHDKAIIKAQNSLHIEHPSYKLLHIVCSFVKNITA